MIEVECELNALKRRLSLAKIQFGSLSGVGGVVTEWSLPREGTGTGALRE